MSSMHRRLKYCTVSSLIVMALAFGGPLLSAPVADAAPPAVAPLPPSRSQAETPTQSATVAKAALPTGSATRTEPAAPASAPAGRATVVATTLAVTPVTQVGRVNTTTVAPVKAAPSSRSAPPIEGSATPNAIPAARTLPSAAPTVTSTSVPIHRQDDPGFTVSIANQTPTIPSIALGGSRTASYSVPVSASVPILTAAYHLTIAATNLTATGASLPAGVSSVTAVSCTGGLLCGTINTVGYPLTMATASAMLFSPTLSGALGGSFTITPTIKVTVPTTAIATTYSGTVTIAIASGP